MNQTPAPLISNPRFGIYVTPLPQLPSRREAETEATRLLTVTVLGSSAIVAHHPSGAPFIEGDEKLKISISHSRHHCLLAVGSGVNAIGVDIEEPRDQLLRVRDRFLAPAEATCVDLLPTPSQLTMLCIYWTAKEAVYKAASTAGLGLKEIKVSLGSDEPEKITNGKAEARGICYNLTFCHLSDGSIVAVAVR